MAVGKASDFLVKNPYIHTGLVETLTQMSDAFNAASRNAIRLINRMREGDYDYETFFADTDGLISRRDPTSVAAATPLALTQDEHILVKLNRKIGPVENTLDSFKKIMRSADEQALDFALGQQAGKGIAVDMLNAGIRSCSAALENQTASKVDASTGTLETDNLVDGLAKFGDGASRIVIWVMHSKAFYDLVKEQIGANIDGVSNFNVAQAMAVTLNRPVLITDSEALVVDSAESPTVNNYYTLGLTADAVRTEISEPETIVREFVTGNESLSVRYQGEFAYNVGVKGFKWDTQNGGTNPTDTALATGSNWDVAMSDAKNRGGVLIQTQ